MSAPPPYAPEKSRSHTGLWITLVVIVVLAAALVGADRYLAHRVESDLASRVASAPGAVTAPQGTTDEGDAADGEDGVDVSVVDIPFLTQVLGGAISTLDVHVPGWDVDVSGSQLRLNDIDISVHNVGTSSPYHAQSVEGTGRVNQDSLQQVLDDQLPQYISMPATVSVTDEGVSLGMEILGQQVTAMATLAIGDNGRSLIITPTTIQAGALNLPLDDLLTEFNLDDLRVPLDPLPSGLMISSLQTSDSGQITATLTGADIDLETLFR